MKKIIPVISIMMSGFLWFSKSEAAPNPPVETGEGAAFMNMASLSFEPSNGVTGAKTVAEIDFGELDRLDEKMIWQEAEAKEALLGNDEYLVGKLKNVSLYNWTDHPITINQAYTGCLCLEARVVRGEKFLLFPYTIPAKQKINVAIGFNFVGVVPGIFHGSVRFCDEDRSRVLATVNIKAKVRGGVKFSEPEIQFGKVTANTKASKLCELIIDKRMYFSLLPGDRLLLEPSSKYVTVNFVKQKVRKDLALGGNALAIKGQLESDVKCVVKVELSKEMPLGKFQSFFRISAESAPGLTILQNVRLPIRGEVVGHMSAFPSSGVSFGELKVGQDDTQAIKVTCQLPVTVESLRVHSSNKNFKARFLKTQRPLAPISAKPEDGEATLELNFTGMGRASQSNTQITISNTINTERLEIRSVAIVGK